MSEREEARVLSWFAQRMKAKLDKNAHKGRRGWKGMSVLLLFEKLSDEVHELQEAIYHPEHGWPNAVMDESVDIANLAMMIADVARERQIHP